MDSSNQRSEAIAAHAKIHRPCPDLPDKSPEQRAVALIDVAGLQSPAWSLQLIAGGQNRDRGPRIDGDPGDPDGREQSNFLRPQQRPGFQDAGPSTQIFPASTDVLPGCGPMPDDELTVLPHHMLLHDDGIGSFWNLRPGQNAHRFTWSHHSAKRPPSLRRADNA